MTSDRQDREAALPEPSAHADRVAPTGPTAAAERELRSAQREIRALRERIAETETQIEARVDELDRAHREVSRLLETARSELAQRQETEAALRERTARYGLIAEGASAGIWDWDVPNGRVYYSPRWKEIRGFSDDEISDDESEWSSRIHPADRQRVLAAVQAHFDGETPYFEEEYRILCKDGSFKWIVDRGIARRDASGRVVRMAGSESDISQRKRAETARRRLAQRLCSVRDEERARISREIHDELGQTLSAIKMELSLRQDADSHGPPGVRSMIELVDAGIESVRRIASDLHPPVLDDLGLRSAVEWQAGEFERRTGIECNTVLAEVDLDRERATTVVRVLQEALLNVYRHARAKQVSITLAETRRLVRLTVRDDGCGMPTSERARDNGLGLLSMRERALIFDGDIELESSPGAGTKVTLTIPLSSLDDDSRPDRVPASA